MIEVMFFLSTIIFFALGIQNAFLFYMYMYGYLRIKNSHIIHALVQLFLWKTLAFTTLAVVSLANLFEQRELSIALRTVGIIPFIAVLHYLMEFAKWSVEQEDEEEPDV